MDFAAAAFGEIGDIERIAMDNSLRDDPDYSDPIGGIEYDGRSNLRIVLAGSGDGRRLLLNTHIDTVPPSEGQDSPFDPQLRDGRIFGRGACDAKGQVATIFLATAALKDIGVRLAGDLVVHIVAEEEVGGNGTLAMIRHGEAADACVVLEPTDMRILSSIRGAVWFRITLRGQGGHSGRAGRSRSALKMGIDVVDVLERYHDRLLAESRGDELFDKFDDPMPLTVGQFHAGKWAAASAGEAVLEGVLGLLPNKTAADVMGEMTTAVREDGPADVAENFDIHFMYRHDASVVSVDHPLVSALIDAGRSAGRQTPVDAMTASCDACYYNNQLQIPTVVFGPGSLSVAHAKDESIELAEVATAAEIIAALAAGWCEEK